MSLDEVVPLLMSDLIINNNNAHRTVPWGTPLKSGLSLLIPPGILTQTTISMISYNDEELDKLILQHYRF